MAVTPVPDLTVPQNKGYVDTDTAPIIHSVRWRHLPSRYIFTDVNDVITYHQDGPLVINLDLHTVSYLDVYLRRDVVISEMKIYLRFVRESDNVLIEEPYLVGENGNTMKIEPDPVNGNLSVVKGIAFTQEDLNNGTPMYDFQNMSNEGVYEVWLKTVTDSGNELHVRVPFQWAIATTPPEDGGTTTEPTTPPSVDPDKLHVRYDEYYVTIIEGDSPFTKRPSTHFRMAGVGMLQTPHCYERVETPKQPPIEKPADEPIVGDNPVEPCSLAVSPKQATAEVGKTVKFTLSHGNKSGIVRIDKKYDSNGLQELSDEEFEVLKEGSFSIEFIVVYKDGQECKVAVAVTGTPAPIPEPEPEPEPPTPAPSCQLKATSSKSSMLVNDTFKIDLTHGNTSGIVTTVISYPNDSFTYDDITKTYRALSAGAFVFEIKVKYTDGQECTTHVTVDVSAPTPPPEPPPGTLYCGDDSVANGNSGFGEYKHAVTEDGIYYIKYDFLGAPDRMYLWIGGKLVHDTGSRTYSAGSPFAFRYKPSDGELKVVMNDGSSGSQWRYTLYCPSNAPSDVKASAPLIN